MSSYDAVENADWPASSSWNVTVRFGGNPSFWNETAIGSALRTIDDALARMDADAQVASVVEPGWATWTFVPGRHQPADMVQAVHRILTTYDPGWWLIDADV
jgi:hypothetical protein